MAIKDIRYTGHTNLANCESEPIHVPGSIQPHGFLMAVDLQSMVIEFCSANTRDFLNLEVKEVLGHHLQNVIGKEECLQIQEHLKQHTQEQSYTLTYQSTPYNASIHVRDNTLIIEIERFPDGALSLPDLYQQSRNFITYLETSNSLRELCFHVVREIKETTGYDRVMIYRFDKEYNGEVFAESVEDHLEPFLGLNYPHTDIPAQARELYMRNLMRIISDVSYEPVPIMTLEQQSTHQSLDLSLSILRSVSPIHIEYLKNMGVGATLTISLIHHKKLWGLITCHHYSPKILPPYTRLSAKLQAHFLTSQISVREASEEYEYTMKMNEELRPLLHSFENQGIHQFKDNPRIYNIINADGMAIISEGKIVTSGKTPAEEDIAKLATWLETKGQEYVVTSRLADEYPEAAHIKDTASGLLFHSLYKASRQSVLWFRGEIEKTVSWAGDPEKAIEHSKDSLSPRKSFALWKQLVAYSSLEWKNPEVEAGIRIATYIQNNLSLTYLIREEKKYRLQTEQLQKANEELSSFNYICSHDLQEPIRKIQVFSNLLLNESDIYQFNQQDVLRKINSSAARVSNQIKDLLEFTRISNHHDVFHTVNLNDCLQKTITDFELTITDKGAIITHEPLEYVQGIAFQLEQLLHNLIGNALKFSSDQKPTIHISLSHPTPEEISSDTPLDPKQSYLCLQIKDNGIGFDQKYAEQIFTIFNRLNDRSVYQGSGIGLAICKKIVENHQGYIKAKSKKGHGATFYIYLPK